MRYHQYTMYIRDELKKVYSDRVEEEYRFAPPRRFRFDFAVPAARLAVEYEGINSRRSGHTSIVGFTSDCEKYNLATLQGWRVLRYTMKNIEQLPLDLKKYEKKD